MPINIEAIVAVDQDFGLAKDGKIPWKNKEDMAFFKDKTIEHIVVMGSKTLLSLPKQAPLNNRYNIVLTNNKEQFVHNYISYGNIVFFNHSELMDYINNVQTNKTIYIIGGKQIYDLLLPLCQKIWVSIIPGHYNCDITLQFNFDNYNMLPINKNTFLLHCYQLN